jgi:sulfite exporter TauE/SafE
MTEFLLTFVAGALGSSHCLGMCGGFALTLGAHASGWQANLARQLIYSTGRVFTYAAFGAAAGYGALRLGKQLPSTVPTQAILALLAGLFLLYEGLRATGILRRRGVTPGAGCLGSKFFGPLLAGRTWSDAFLAGLFTGFLPCGLVYAFLALASASQSTLHGALRMTAFGLGTIPLMVAAGLGGAALGLAARRHLFRLAGWCVTISGAVSVARGISFLLAFNGATDAGCPFCQ